MFKHVTLFFMGGISYIMIELLWRGASHWSMFVLGGLCFVIIGLINEIVFGAVIITVLEFITGYIVNLKLHMYVWSYYDVPYNIMGQVCLPYTVIWFFLSIVCSIADDYMRYFLFGEEKPKLKWI